MAKRRKRRARRRPSSGSASTRSGAGTRPADRRSSATGATGGSWRPPRSTGCAATLGDAHQRPQPLARRGHRRPGRGLDGPGRDRRQRPRASRRRRHPRRGRGAGPQERDAATAIVKSTNVILQHDEKDPPRCAFTALARRSFCPSSSRAASRSAQSAARAEAAPQHGMRSTRLRPSRTSFRVSQRAAVLVSAGSKSSAAISSRAPRPTFFASATCTPPSHVFARRSARAGPRHLE